MSGYLPAGITDAMCEPNDPACGSCGHLYSDHYYEDGQEPIFNHEKLERSSNIGNHDIQYDSSGKIIHACDCTRGKTQEEKLKNQCDCKGFNEEPYEQEYEPDYDDYYEDRD